MSPWISVKDRLPDNNLEYAYVIVGSKQGDMFGWTIGRWSKIEGWELMFGSKDDGASYETSVCVFQGDSNAVFGTDSITHWMPIPPLPEEK